MKAKKIITLVLAVMVAAMSFAGCGSSSDDTTTTSADGTESTKTALSGTVATDGSPLWKRSSAHWAKPSPPKTAA